MKIAICANGNTLDSMTDPRFGRCSYFIIANTDDDEFEAVPNTASTQAQGAGIAAAQAVAKYGVEAVVAGNFGPNAYQGLNAGGIKIYIWTGGTVRQALESVKSGTIQHISAANVQAHYGMNQGTDTLQNNYQNNTPGMGQGMGRGMGRGRGRRW